MNQRKNKLLPYCNVRLLFSTGIFIMLFILIYRIDLIPNSFLLEVEHPEVDDTYQLFYDTGNGFNQVDSIKTEVKKNNITVKVKFFPLPDKQIKSIRIDPGNHEGNITIKSIMINHDFHKLGFSLTLFKWTQEKILKNFRPLNHIREFNIKNNSLYITSIGNDPYFGYNGNFNTICSFLNKKAIYLKCLFIILIIFLIFILFFITKLITTFLHYLYNMLGSSSIITNLKNRKTIYFNAFTIFMIIYILFILYPSTPLMPLRAGLDPSWMYGINFLSNSNFIYGKDITFTYGPMGYLLYPMNIEANLFYSFLFRLIIHITFGVLLFSIYLKDKIKLLHIILFLISYSIINIFVSITVDYYLIIIIILLMIKSLESKKYYAIPAIMNGLLSALLLFMKFNMGISALICNIIFFITTIVREKEKSKIKLILIISSLSYILTLSILIINKFKNIKNFIQCMKTSIAIAEGYSITMSIDGPRNEWIIAILCIIVFIIFLIKFAKEHIDSPAFHIVIPTLVVVFFSFKHGFVRQDGHVLIFIFFLPSIVTLFILLSKNIKTLLISLLTYLIICFLLLPVTIKYLHPSSTDYYNVLTGKRTFNNFKVFINLEDTKKQLNIESKKNLEIRKLPEDWLTLLKNSTSNDVIPWEIMYLPANELIWKPSPAIQLYTAFNPYLDKCNASYYMNHTSPDYLIFEFMDIDGRNLFLSYPETLHAILKNYEVVKTNMSRGIILLKKNTKKEEKNLVSSNDHMNINEWVKIPTSDNLMALTADMTLNLYGKIIKILFRISPVYINLLYESGKTATYRIIPENLNNGVLISHIPVNLDDVTMLFSNPIYMDRVSKFKISGPGAKYYKNSINIRFQEVFFKNSLIKSNISFSSLKKINSTPLFCIDSINNILLGKTKQPIYLSNIDKLIITGWAVDKINKKSAGDIVIDIDGKLFPGLITDRTDVAKYFNYSENNLGFKCIIPVKEIGKGKHTVTMKILTNDKKCYYKTDNKILVQIN